MHTPAPTYRPLVPPRENPRRIAECDGYGCPHTYGVRFCPCGSFSTEPCRPTACIEHAVPTPSPSTDHCSLITVHSSYTFSAKEKDVETGLSYFGSRYYSSDLSIWLSVDPMSDKYTSLSPYVYCADNPVKLVDPNGEEISLETIYKKDANGNNTSEVERYNIKITGKILNNSGMKIDMEKARNQIVEHIESSFSGTTEDGIPVSVKADLQVVNSFRQISDKDHLFSLDDGVTLHGHPAQGRVNKIGGKTAHIDAHLFRGPCDNLLHSGAKAATHEMGHLFGLQHGDSEGLFDVIRSPRLGTNVSSRQLSSIIHKLKYDITVSRCYRFLNITDR